MDELLELSKQFWQVMRLPVNTEDDLIMVGDSVYYTPQRVAKLEREMAARYNKASNAHEPMYWEDFKILSTSTQQQVASLRDGIQKAMKWASDPQGFLVIQPSDSSPRFRLGKTALARAIHTHCLMSNVVSVFWTVPDIVQAWYSDGRNLRERQRNGLLDFTETVKDSLIYIGSTATVLVLDDFAAYYKTSYADSFLETILISRSDDSRKGTVITTSQDKEYMGKNYPLLFSRMSSGTPITLNTDQYTVRKARGAIDVGNAYEHN